MTEREKEREKLIELIQNAVDGCARHWAEIIADHLLSNGVIVPLGHNDPVGERGECGLKAQCSKEIKAEAVKGFAKMLKSNMSNIAGMEFGGFTYFCVGYDLIDNLVKEFTEGKNDG